MQFVIYSASIGYVHDPDRAPCDRAVWGNYEALQDKQTGRTKRDDHGQPLREVVEREGWLVRLDSLADLETMSVETGCAIIYNSVKSWGEQLPQLTIVDGKVDL